MCSKYEAFTANEKFKKLCQALGFDLISHLALKGVVLLHLHTSLRRQKLEPGHTPSREGRLHGRTSRRGSDNSPALLRRPWVPATGASAGLESEAGFFSCLYVL